MFEEPHNCSYALSGSELGVQMLHLLLDHRGEVGFRDAEKVIVFVMKKEAETLDWKRPRTFMIMLSYSYADRSSNNWLRILSSFRLPLP